MNKELILKLRAEGHTIGAIHKITGLSITIICEVIYEQNQADIHRDGAASLSWNGVF